MCNPTSQPPRRELYELEQTIRTQQGPFSLPKPPRLGSLDWLHARHPQALAVFNSAYDIDGSKQHVEADPWCVIKEDGDWEYFATHAEALAYAFTNAPKKEEKEAA